jgi:hypothetical protein
MIGGPHKSSTPATDQRGRITRYRVDLPHAGVVETESGRFEATAYAERRRGWKGRYLGVRDRVLGTTLASHRLESERLSKVKALAVFSSDALSSVAYATQEILFVLLLAGPAAMKYSLPIAGVIVLLLAIVIASYRQTVRAYPGGGGAYIVAHENLGIAPGLIAASALLIDYVLTVSVSTEAGIDALARATTAKPAEITFCILMGVPPMALGTRYGPGREKTASRTRFARSVAADNASNEKGTAEALHSCRRIPVLPWDAIRRLLFLQRKIVHSSKIPVGPPKTHRPVYDCIKKSSERPEAHDY